MKEDIKSDQQLKFAMLLLKKYNFMHRTLLPTVGLVHWELEESISIHASAELISPEKIQLPLSVHVCLGLVVEYWSIVGASTCHSYSELYYLCHISSLF